MYTNLSPANQYKHIDEYIADYPTWLLSDHETRKQSIVNNKLFISKLKGADNKTPIKAKSAKKTVLDNDWTQTGNIVFGIHNNEQFMNTLATYKKVKVGTGYIYIESPQYICILIKRPGKYPLVVIRIPVEYPFTYINERYIGIMFSFAIESLYNKDTTTKSKNKQYKLYLTKDIDTYVLNMETIINNDVKKSQINNIKKEENDIINIVLKPSMMRFLNTFTLSKTNDISYTINNMNVIVMKKLPINSSVISFDTLQNKQSAYIEFRNDKLYYVVKAPNRIDEKMIVSKADSDYWPQIDYNGSVYNIHDYDQMFKLAHYSNKTTKDGIYYIFSTFLNTFAFTILITDQNVMINENNKIYNFQDIFSKGTQVLETYLLIEEK